MKVVFYTNIVSPHQLPWCTEMVKLIGEKNFLYIAEERLHQERQAMGWQVQNADWIRGLDGSSSDQHLLEIIENCDILICSLRKFDLFQMRIDKGLISYYMFERWFKPPMEALRMLDFRYLKMCLTACKIAQSSFFRLLPIGVPAVADWMKMENICHGHLFRKIVCKKSQYIAAEQVSFRKNMFLWGYFVTESPKGELKHPDGILKVMWCGRMLDWKRVDTIVQAMISLLEQGREIHLQLIGSGPEESRLKQMADKWQTIELSSKGISFQSSVPMTEIRKLMQQNDVYVLSSDGGEGWGAAANEAMNEGMILIGTHEAGSTATMIEDGKNGFLYSAKNVLQLAQILDRVMEMKKTGADLAMRQAARNTITTNWSPAFAAQRLFEQFAR